MNKENLKFLVDEYSLHSRKASNISRGVVIVIAVISLYYVHTVPRLCKLYLILDILQYTYLATRAQLTFSELISIRTSNKINIIGEFIFYVKIGISLVLLGSYL